MLLNDFTMPKHEGINMDFNENKYVSFILFFIFGLIIYVFISTILFISVGKSELIDHILMFFWVIYIMIGFRRINKK